MIRLPRSASHPHIKRTSTHFDQRINIIFVLVSGSIDILKNTSLALE